MSVKLIFTIWVESVVSAPLGAEIMKGVIGEKKESTCEVMWANERKVDYQYMAKTEDLLKVRNSMKNWWKTLSVVKLWRNMVLISDKLSRLRIMIV